MFTAAGRPTTEADVPAPTTSMMSPPLVPFTVTVSAWASPVVPPIVPARLTLTCVTSVPLRSLTVMVSVPPSALTSMCSTSLRSMMMLAMLRVNRARPPLAERSKISSLALPLNSSVSMPAWPSTTSLPSPGSHWNTSSPAPSRRVVALLAVDEVVAVAAEQESAPLLPRMVSLPVPPSTVTPMSAARLPVALKLSSPPFMLTTSFSVVPMSMLNGAGSTRSKRTRVPLAVAVKTSAPLPPLTSTVSVPSPPSTRSVSSPGFQIMRSSPASPNIWSSPSPPVSVSLPSPPCRRSAA